MVAQAEIGLMALVTGLYIYDSALLLYCNEAVLLPRGREGWAVAFGSDKLQMLGKELFVPNPLQLHRPMFRLAWRFEGEARSARGAPADARHLAAWSLLRNAYRGLAPLVWGMALALFVLLPLGLFTSLGERMLLLALAMLYGSLFLALAWLWLNRARLRIPARQLASLSFECLVCAPFALNLVRHLSAKVPVPEDLTRAARRLQAPDDWRSTRLLLIARLDDEIECAEPGSERTSLLRQHRQVLAQEDPCPAPNS